MYILAALEQLMPQYQCDETISRLEHAAMELLLAGENSVLSALRIQYQSTSVSSLEYTGSGLWIDYTVTDTQISLPRGLGFCISDIAGELFPGEIPIGFLLWIDRGALSSLEVFTFDPDPWPDKIEGFRLRYLGGSRDLESTKKAWSHRLSECAE